MKPRIRRRFGIWFCGLPSELMRGHGYTPKQAYDDWREQVFLLSGPREQV